MTAQDILDIVKETFKEEISTSCSETVLGLESCIVGEDNFYKELQKKFESNITEQTEEDLLP